MGVYPVEAAHSLLVRLVSVCSAVKGANAVDVARTMQSCQTSFRQDGLTGMMIYDDGLFWQVLEGSENLVASRFRRGYRDPRFCNQRLLTVAYIKEKQFKTFDADYLVVGEKLHPNRQAIGDILKQDSLGAETATSPAFLPYEQ